MPEAVEASRISVTVTLKHAGVSRSTLNERSVRPLSFAPLVAMKVVLLEHASSSSRSLCAKITRHRVC